MTMNSAAHTLFPPVVALPVALDRDSFLTSVMAELATILQDGVGKDQACSLVSIAGRKVGEQINEGYKAALAVTELSRERVSEVMVDVSRRTGDGFYIIEEDDEKIVLGNSACMCALKVANGPALCLMAANVFGVIAAENLGYARVVLEQMHLQSRVTCKVIVHLAPSADGEGRGREYLRS